MEPLVEYTRQRGRKEATCTDKGAIDQQEAESTSVKATDLPPPNATASQEEAEVATPAVPLTIDLEGSA
eukprot:2313810-Amphidinium_carterae.1